MKDLYSENYITLIKKDLYSENYITLIKENKEDSKKWKDIPYFCTGIINILKMAIPSKAI